MFTDIDSYLFLHLFTNFTPFLQMFTRLLVFIYVTRV